MTRLEAERTEDPRPDPPGLRAQGRGLRLAAMLMAVPVLILFVLGVAEYRFWAPVARDGMRVPATVVGATVYSKASDRIRVAFPTPDGRLVEASVPVSDVSAYRYGSTVVVAYDPANPKRARTLDGWEPPYVMPFGVASVLALVVAALGWRAWRWPARLRRVAATGASRSPMLVAGVVVPGRVAVPWAVLWPPGASPAHPPTWACRLADVDDVPAAPAAVEVAGRLRKGAVVVLHSAGRTIWPAGKLTRPRRAVLRSQRRAEAPAAVEAEPAAGDLPAGATLPSHAGSLPPLPDELFTPRRRPRVANAKMLVAVVPMAVVMVGPLLAPDVLEARRHRCPAPPTAGPGDTASVDPGELPQLLPVSLPGYQYGRGGYPELAASGSDQLSLAMIDAGWVSEYTSQFAAGGTSVRTYVDQFATVAGAGRYEAQRMATLCVLNHHALPVPAGSGAVGQSFTTPDAGSFARYSFIRASRDYTLIVEGARATDQVAALASLLATAR